MKQKLPTLDYWKRYEELSDNGEFDAAKVIDIKPAVVALTEIAVVLLQLIKEILQVFVQHLLGTVWTNSHIGRRDHLCFRSHANHELGTESVEVSAKIEVLAIVRLAPLGILGRHQRLAQRIDRTLNGYAHEGDAPRVSLRLCADQQKHGLQDNDE